MTNFGITHNQDCMIYGAALDLIKPKNPLQLLMDKYGLRQFELSNRRIWKDIQVSEADQAKLQEYCDELGILVMDKKYEKTRFC